MTRRPAVSADPAERALLRAATRTVALRMAVAVAILFVIAGAVLVIAFTQRESAAARDVVHDTAVTADDVGDPPDGVYLVAAPFGPDGKAAATDGAPRAVAALDVAKLPTGPSEITLGNHRYDAYVIVSDKGIRFAALTDVSEHGDVNRLMLPLLIAGIIAVLGSALIGGLVGRHAARPLAAALSMQRGFVANASHELRTPLTILHTRAQLLRRRFAAGSDPAVLSELDDLLVDTRVLSAVVTDLLLSAELTYQPNRTETVNLRQLVETTVHRYRPHTDEQEINVRFEPSDDGPFTVLGIASALGRAIASLLDNAIAHEHPGGEIVITATRRGSEIVLAISDDGEGIDPDQIPALLQRFARGPSSGGQGRRFGLGLSLVHEIVRTHGGTLEVTGSPGVGATFALVLPAAAAPRTSPPTDDSRKPEHERSELR